MNSAINKINEGEFEDFNEEKFNIEISIAIAQEHLGSIDEHELTVLNFDSDVWYLYKEISDYLISYDFRDEKIKIEGMTTQEIFNLKIIIKCWTASLLAEYEPLTVQKYLSRLIKEMRITKGFRIELLEEFIEKTMLGHSARRQIVSILYNFFDYYDGFEGTEDYLKALACIPIEEGRVRTIPTVKDCLKFVWVMDDFFKNTDKNDERYIYYYPLRLWWSITSVVPIRSGEFLIIKRDCTSSKEGRYYLSLPRIKTKGNKGKPVATQVEITQNVFMMLEEYLGLTEGYGYSSTLISYKAHRSIKCPDYVKKKKKRYVNIMTYKAFLKLLNDFYENIIAAPPYNLSVRPIGDDSEYQIRESLKNGLCNFDIERRLRPNDTRHIAFISLMLQGFHPIEIARLGGHSTVYSQRHYQQHNYFLADSGISKLFKTFSMTGQHIGNPLFDVAKSNEYVNIGKSFRERFIFSPAKIPKNKWEKLKLGYCTAEVKDCQVECVDCKDYWRIEMDEFIEKRKEIERWIKQKQDKIKLSYKTLFNLHQKLISKTYDKINPRLTDELAIESKKLRGLLEGMDEFSERYGGWLKYE